MSRSDRYRRPSVEGDHRTRSPVGVHETRRPHPARIVEGEVHPSSRSPTLVHRPSRGPTEPITIQVRSTPRSRSRSRSPPSDLTYLPTVIRRSPSPSPRSDEGPRQRHRLPRSRSSSPALPVRLPSRRRGQPPTIIEVPQAEHRVTRAPTQRTGGSRRRTPGKRDMDVLLRMLMTAYNHSFRARISSPRDSI